MTKKEQAAFEALQNEIRLLKAWRLTEDVAPDVIPPEKSFEYTTGFYSHAYASSNWRAEPAVSSCVSHFTGADAVNRVKAGLTPYNGSQRGIRLHAKRSDALRACRNEVEKQVRRSLAELDRDIEEALAAESGEVSQ